MKLVAMWRERSGPIAWGRKSSRLSWYYNEALLAFETGCSPHGNSACHAAIAYGYQRIYKRERHNVATRDETELLGWRTDVQTKPMMVDRVRETLEVGWNAKDASYLPSEIIARELKEQSFDENERIVCERHDDMMIAFSIALMVRDRAYTKGLLRREKEKAKSEHERYWENAERKLKLAQRGVQLIDRRKKLVR